MAMCRTLCKASLYFCPVLVTIMLLWPAPRRLPMPESCSGGASPLTAASHDPQDREFDVVVHGATGLTGALASHYLATQPRSVRYAIAGRSQAKLDALLADITAKVGTAGIGRVPTATIVADSLNAEQLAAMARRTKVVLATAGPYAQYGDPLVKACAEQGTHYADLSGEPFWQRRAIDRFHAMAEGTGAKVVLAAGFDSVPFDLGAQLVTRALEATGAASGDVSITTVVTKEHGAASGSTIASALGQAQELWEGGAALREQAADPYLLVPGVQCRADANPTGWGPLLRYDRTTGALGFAHFMAPVNARIVRRTFELLGRRGVSYSEGLSLGGALDAGADFLSHVLSGEMKLLPSPGEGPPLSVQLAGSYEATLVATGGEASGRRAELSMVGRGDPGYRHTSKLFAEVGICLADRACHRAGVGGGVLTSMAALEPGVLATRLREAKHDDGSPLLTYEVVATPAGKGEL